MKLIAQKPCSFGGKKFYIGDEVPADIVLDPMSQENMGVLSVISDEAGISPAPSQEGPSTIDLTIPVKEGDLALALTHEGLQAAINVLAGTATEAEPVIEQMTDGDALILLHIIDTRKAVKAAAEARAKALNEPEEGEQ